MIRVRFAPSPTGYLHIGSLRTALYNFLLAKKYRGKFILRIEDTDVKREVPGALESLIKTLQKVGLDWDEGVFLSKKQNKFQFKGKYRPYIQSQRLYIYQNLAQKLVDNDKAYYCFCSLEKLEKMRQKQLAQKLLPVYDRRCRKLTPKQIHQKFKAKIPYVIRLKVPEQGIIKFNDLIRGEVKFDLKNIDDQVLLKSDGYPTYHLANVTDDHLMAITHVIRGEEWLPSVPKHLLIYQFFGWPVPYFAHLPLLLNPDRSKLSKRQGDVAVEEYLAKGYLPEALINFVALLGWNPGTEQEILSLKELIKEFSLAKVQKAGAIFNHEKLDWLNGCYIRKKSITELTKLSLPFLIQAGLIEKIKNEKFKIKKYKLKTPKFKIKETGEVVDFNWLKKIVTLERERLKKLSEIGELADFFFTKKINYSPEMLFWKKMNKKEVLENLNLINNKFEKISPNRFWAISIKKILEKLGQKKGIGEIFWPLRVALSGKKGSPPPEEIAEILGKEKTHQRIKEAIRLLNFL